MRNETIEHHVRALNGILASFAASKRLDGQFAREREAMELLEKGRDKLLAELKSRDVVQNK